MWVCVYVRVCPCVYVYVCDTLPDQLSFSFAAEIFPPLNEPEGGGVDYMQHSYTVQQKV